MKALLFILAVAFGLLALATRKHLNHELDPDDDSPQVEETIKSSQAENQNLNDAITRIARAPAPRPQAFLRPAHNARPGVPPPAPAAQKAGAPTALAGEVAGYVRQMAENPTDAAAILERGLSVTNSPESLQLRLNLLQAALNVPASESMKEPALRELTTTVVEPGEDTSADAEQVQAVETKRQILSSAYKLFLNTTKDAESAYSDTTRVLDYQRDQATKDLLIYDCLSRYPELRPRMLPNQ